MNYNMAKKDYEILIKTREKQHKNQKLFDMIPNLVKFLKQKELLQVIFFSFSKVNCEMYANMINSSINLVTIDEINNINQTFDSKLSKYKDEYSSLPQYKQIKTMINIGVAYHHAGLLPVLKEIIEILFKKGLIKVLFATETFAVGVNMPTRTVIFTELEKYTKTGRRFLSTAEYKQMSGRAGRRGIDTMGNVIIFPLHSFPDEIDIKQVMLGRVPHISSKFKIDYQFILKALQNSDSQNNYNLQNIFIMINKSLFYSDTMDIIRSISIDLETAEKKLEVVKKTLSQNDIDSIDMKTLYKFENKKQQKDFDNIIINVSKNQQKQLQKIKSSIDKNVYKQFCDCMDLQAEIRSLRIQLDENSNYINYCINTVIMLLQQFSYITTDDINSHIQLLQKGVVAAQINECNPLLLTEMIYAGIFDGLNAVEIVGVLALFIEPENKDDVMYTYEGTQIFHDKINKVHEIVKMYNIIEKKIGIIIYEEIWNISYEFMNVAMSWVRNDSPAKIEQYMGDMYIGQFVRNMIKINNIVNDMVHLCQLAGKVEIVPILADINGKILREYVSVNSLHLSDI